MLTLTVRQRIFLARVLHRVVLLARRATGRGPDAQVRRRGLKWHLDLNEGIDLSIFLAGAYEPATVRAYENIICPGDTVIDVGANIGAHTLHFAQLVGDSGRVYAFEPTDFAYAKLRRNLEMNSALLPRVEALQMFLVSASSDPVPASIFSSWPMGDYDDLDADHGGRAQSVGSAASITGDEFCAMRGLNRLDFLKIDVDGYELAVLKGFTATIDRFRPPIFIELAPFVHDSTSGSFSNMLELLLGFDYVFSRVDTGQRLASDPGAISSLIPHGASMNVLLTPPKARR